MDTKDFVCEKLEQHLNKMLNVQDSNNQGVAKKQRNRRQKKKKNERNVSNITSLETSTSSSPNLAKAVTYQGKEIVDFIPNQTKPKKFLKDSVQNDISKNKASSSLNKSGVENNTTNNPEVPELQVSTTYLENESGARGLDRGRSSEPSNLTYVDGALDLAEDSKDCVKQGQSRRKRNKEINRLQSFEGEPKLPEPVENEDVDCDFDSNKSVPRRKKRERKNISQKFQNKKERQLMNDIELLKQFQQDFENELAAIDPEVRKRLRSEYIFPLEQMSFKFPEAIFYCHVCHYHVSMKDYESHIETKNHQTMKNVRDEEYFLKNIPRPSETHCSALTKLLKETALQHGLSLADLEERQIVAKGITQFIQENGLDGCELQVYGSSLTGFGTKNSDLNLDLTYSSSESISVILPKLLEILEKCGHLTDLVTDFESKVPKICFKDTKANLRCNITWRNVDSVQTSQLFCRYRDLDPRVHTLGTAFKYWANMCEIDNARKGTLASHAYTIMLIYFLQQVQPPVLPVLHEIDPNMDADNPSTVRKIEKWKSLNKNKKSIGELWIDLFKFYGMTFKASHHVVCIRFIKRVSKAERKWIGTVIAIEDPSYPKRNLSRVISNSAIYSYISTRLRSGYKYFGIPQTKKGPLFTKLDPEELTHTKGRQTTSLSVESSDLSSNEEQDEGDNVDPDLLESRKRTRRRRRNTSEISRETEDLEEATSSSSEKDLLEDHDPDISLDDLKLIENLNLGDSGDDQFCAEPESSDDDPDLAMSGAESASASPSKRKVTVASRLVGKAAQKESPSTSQESEPDLCFRFDKDVLTDKKSPPLYCGECGEEGHIQEECASLCLPVLTEWIPLSSIYSKSLDKMCVQVMETCAPRSAEIQARKSLLDNLQEYIQLFYPGAELELFGSSCNGFGFSGSDMDMCLTLADSKDGEEEDDNYGEFIGNLAQCLKRNEGLYNVLAITTAKVPIVKFIFQKRHIECDISLYNTLAQHNTRMLLTYCKIDKRVQLLGYTMKLFVKTCGIGDASRGSLSSYAYILMVLYYLQQRKPAVIPVLQELHPKDQDRPKLIVDGWNAWFYEDIENLATVWPEIGQNTESIGELWIGLLRFYTEEFDFKRNVVCIRQKALLTRIDKFWNSRMICIEDPFDLNHNLGVGVSKKMSIYIMKALIRGREIFGISFDDIFPYSLMNFLFDAEKLVTEDPPNDRGCRFCGKIGHKVRDCPSLQRNHRQPRRKKQQQDHFQNEKKSQNNRQRTSMHEADQQPETVKNPKQAKTKKGDQQRPRIQQNSRLMQNIKNFVESNHHSEQQRRPVKTHKPKELGVEEQEL